MTQTLEFDEDGYKKAMESQFDGQYKDIENQLSQKLVISIMGIVSVGKTTLIKQILDKKYANFSPEISPIPGTTKKVEHYKFDNNVIIADTPGLEDVNKEVANETLKFINYSDIILYLFNATIGVSETQKRAYDEVKRQNKPILVILNKIDAVRKEEDRVALLNHTKDILKTDDVLATIAEDGYNVDKVEDWISETLKNSGKDLLFAKIARQKDAIVDKWILGASTTAAAIGALPIPGSDIVPLTALQIGLILKIAHVYGFSITREKAKALIAASSTGFVARTIFRQIIKIWPGAGSVVGAILAGAFTFALGKTMKKYFKSDMTIPMEDLGKVAKEYANEAKKYEDEFKKGKNN